MTTAIPINTPAPGFEMPDFNGKKIHLAEYCQRKNVLLVFNRGFT
jgi:peroxiredoxin